MIIDMHTHCFPDALAPRAISSPAYNEHSGADGTVACQKRLMRQFGIEKSVLLSVSSRPQTQSGVNRFAVSHNGGDFVAFGSVHPFSPNAVEAVQALYEAGIRGVKFHTAHQQFHFDDPRCVPLYRKIGALGMVTVIHGGKSQRCAEYWTWPEQVANVIDCFGDAPFICAHMGGIGICAPQIDFLTQLPVFVDTAMISTWMDPHDFHSVVHRIGVKRVLFGSDLPWGSLAREIDYINMSKLSDAEKDDIFYWNASNLLRLLPR